MSNQEDKKNVIYQEHEYLNIIGSFLSVKTSQVKNTKQIQFTHNSVDGVALNTKTLIHSILYC